MIKCFTLNWHFWFFKKRYEVITKRPFILRIYLPLWRRPNRRGKLSVFRKQFSNRCCTHPVKIMTSPEMWSSRCWGHWYHSWWPIFSFVPMIQCFALILKRHFQIFGESKQRRKQFAEGKRWALKYRCIYDWFGVVKEAELQQQIISFPSNLFVTGDVTINLSMWQGQRRRSRCWVWWSNSVDHIVY